MIEWIGGGVRAGLALGRITAELMIEWAFRIQLSLSRIVPNEMLLQ